MCGHAVLRCDCCIIIIALLLQIVDGPKAALASINTAAVTSGNDAKQQISQTVSSFRGSATNIKDSVFGRLDDIQGNYQPMTAQYDGYRYIVSIDPGSA